MQNVSAEWIDNQNSLNQKQGYVIIEIEIPDGSKLTISTLDTGGRNMKQITHKRGYDPMGLSLPYNDCTIELFNYNKEYDFLYDNYEYANLPVTVKYGFCLSSNETIPGGKFVTSVINKEDDVLVIECVSTFELKADQTVKRGENADDDIVMFDLYGEYKAGISENDLHNQVVPLAAGDILENVIENSIAVSYGNKLKDIEILILPQESITISEAIQYSTNISLQKCIISRDNTVVFSESNVAPAMAIKQLNMMKKPIYKRTERVKDIEVTTRQYNDEDAGEATFDYRNGISGSPYGFQNDVYQRVYLYDYEKYKISAIDANVIKVVRGMVPTHTTTTVYV